MGEERLARIGMKAGRDYAVYSAGYLSQIEHGELAVLAFLHRNEIDGPAWKQGLKKQFEQEGDTSSAQDFDYDWADESIHLLYGHKWVLHRLGGNQELLEQVMDETVERITRFWKESSESGWDYEPYLSRIKNKLKEFGAAAHV